MSAQTVKTKWQFAAGLALVYVGFTLPCAADTLNCPVPQATHNPGVLKETPVQIAETGSFLTSSKSANRVSEVVADLRKRYPNVENAEIENYLVTAYCPAVARINGLSVAEQKARLDRFAHQASVTVYGH